MKFNTLSNCLAGIFLAGFVLLSNSSFASFRNQLSDGIKISDEATKWNLNVEGFVSSYYDKGRNAFAINTVKQPTDQWAAATSTFLQQDGKYTVVFTSLMETDGECSYRLFIDDKLILSFKNPRIYGTDTAEYAPYTKQIQDAKITKGSIIRVEFLSNSNGLVPENDAFGYARARWQDIKFILQE